MFYFSVLETGNNPWGRFCIFIIAPRLCFHFIPVFAGLPSWTKAFRSQFGYLSGLSSRAPGARRTARCVLYAFQPVPNCVAVVQSQLVRNQKHLVPGIPKLACQDANQHRGCERFNLKIALPARAKEAL